MFETRPVSVANQQKSGTGIYLSPSKCRCASRRSDLLTLTARQIEVLKGVADGLSNKEIGRRLGISHFTVRNCVSRLLQMLDQPSRTILRQSEIDQSKTNMTVVTLAAGTEERPCIGLEAEGHRNAAQRTKNRHSAGCMQGSLQLSAIKSAISDGTVVGITLKIGNTVVSGCLRGGALHFPGLGVTFDVEVAENEKKILETESDSQIGTTK